MSERQRHAFSPIILMSRDPHIKIHVTPEYMIAVFGEPRDNVLRRFDHIDDLHDLSLRGLTKLAEEFYLELTGGIHGTSHNADNDQLHRRETGE